jgi:hypothetical protein
MAVRSYFLASAFNLTSIPFETAQRIKNKYEFRQLCADLDIFTPNYLLIKSEYRGIYIEELKSKPCDSSYLTNNSKSCLFPVIVKFVFGMGKGNRILKISNVNFDKIILFYCVRE